MWKRKCTLGCERDHSLLGKHGSHCQNRSAGLFLEWVLPSLQVLWLGVRGTLGLKLLTTVNADPRETRPFGVWPVGVCSHTLMDPHHFS